ncbi:hypothetical protein Q7P35_004704 [Cladosporium inversicolor]
MASKSLIISNFIKAISITSRILPQTSDVCASTETSTLTSPPEWSTTTETQVSTVTETQPLPSSSQPISEPRDPFSIRYNWGYGGNEDCGGNAVISVSAPNDPDFMILSRDNYDEIPINSANYSLTLTPLNGRKLCTFHGFDEYGHCDWEGVPQTIEMRETRDGLNLRCPHSDFGPVDAPYDGHGTSTVTLQIGISYGGSVAAEYTQRRGERINIAQNNQLNNVGDVQVTVDCRNVREVQSTNNCQFPILLGKPSAQDSQVIQPYSTASFELDENERGAIFTALHGQYYCARNERTNEEACAYDMIIVGPLDSLDTHSFQLSCPNGSPSPLDISGLSIPIEARGNGFDQFNIAVQVGCEDGFPGGITTADPRTIFESLSGRQICATVDRTSLNACGIDNIVAPSLADGDDVTIRCPDNGPPRPGLDNTILASIGTTNTSPNLALQIGCEEGNSCLSQVRSSYGTYVELNYPIVPPRVRIRVRILGGTGNGQFFSYVEWMVGFSGRDKKLYYQVKGKWFEVVVPTGAESIEIEGNAVVSGEIPDGGPTSMPDDGPVT